MTAPDTVVAWCVVWGFLLLAGCGARPDAAPPPAPWATARPELGLQRCRPPVPPPPVPDPPRTIDALAAYAWAEARARWRTADRLEDCKRQLDRVIDWMGEEGDE